MYTVYAYAVALLFIAGLISFIIVRLPFVRKIFLPTAVVAGLILLTMGPEVAGKITPNWSFPSEVYSLWRGLPHVLINIVFAALFLGKPLIKFRDMWRLAGPQVAYGQMIAWGQYATGGLITLLVLTPLFGFPAIGAALTEMSFEGGHGTVAGLDRVFTELNFQEGRDIALGLATFSLVTAILLGIIIINIGRRKNLFHDGSIVEVVRTKVYLHKIIHDMKGQGVRMRQTINPLRLAMHAGLVAMGVTLGWAIHRILLLIELATWGKSGDLTIIGYLPIFPLCIFGGMLAQAIWHKIGFTTSREIIEIYSSIALMVLISTAIGTMSLEFFSVNGGVFSLLYLSGVLWVVFSFAFLAKRMFRRYWFQNAIISFGQGMGMTATGLLFAQMTDPKNRTGAVEGFGYKQLMFEPLMGGGLVTALSMPLIVALGLPVFTTICAVICIGWMLFGLLHFGRR